MAGGWDLPAETPAIVRRAVQRKLGLFSRWPDLSVDDLVSEGMIAAHDAWASFDASKATWSTHVYRAVCCQLIDLYRGRCRDMPASGCDCALLGQVVRDGVDDDADGDLYQWLANLYRLCRRYTRQASVCCEQEGMLDLAQCLAIACLQGRLSLGFAELARTVSDRRIMEALHLRAVPSVATLRRARRRAEEYVILLRAGVGGGFEADLQGAAAEADPGADPAPGR